MTDYGQACIWRVPPGGGKPKLWLTSHKLDGTEFGTTGIELEADRQTLMVGQGSSAGPRRRQPGDGQALRGPDRQARCARATAALLGERTRPTSPTASRSPARVASTCRPSASPPSSWWSAPTGTRLERFPKAPLSGDNGSPIPFDNPSSVAFAGRRLIVANQSVIAGDTTHMALLDVYAGEKGLKPLIPRRAGLGPKRHKRHA